MGTELRWILLGLSVLLLGGIWWWGAWRAKKSPKNTQWREPAATTADAVSLAPAIRAQDESQSRDWGVPPFEPLSIHTDDFAQVELIDIPMMAASAPLAQHNAAAGLDLDFSSEPGMGRQPEIDLDLDGVFEPSEAAEAAAAPEVPQPAVTAPVGTAPVSTPPAEPAPQRIVTVRVSALGDARWSGADLLDALDTHGMGYGRYKVFHRKHTDGRTLFCAASLVEPGTFDIDKMPHEEFRGLTLFAVLPGPAESLYTIDSLIITAGDLAESLNGEVQDSHGARLTPQRAEALREEVARY